MAIVTVILRAVIYLENTHYDNTNGDKNIMKCTL